MWNTSTIKIVFNNVVIFTKEGEKINSSLLELRVLLLRLFCDGFAATCRIVGYKAISLHHCTVQYSLILINYINISHTHKHTHDLTSLPKKKTMRRFILLLHGIHR